MRCSSSFFSGFLLLLLLLRNGGAAQAGSKVHIVYMGEKVKDLQSHEARDLHLDTLCSALGESQEECGKRVHYSYSKGFNGFAASLSEEEADAVLGMPGVLSVFPSNTWKLATTRSYTFLGLDPVNPAGTWQTSNFGSGVIIGIFDSGIWPEARSFSAEGLPPPPPQWKGACVEGEQFNASICNNKLIGARYYYNGFLAEHDDIRGSLKSARDEQGHGSHVSSTAAGALVQGAGYGGLAYGDARGGAPLAHLAVYKICWINGGEAGCSDADILAAFDDAILDGVDIISLSLAGSEQHNYFEDAIAIGTLHAIQKGIFVTAAAGNAGPHPSSVVNVAPWITTVGANSIDRQFQATVTLGSSDAYKGYGSNMGNLTDKQYPLVYAASSGFDSSAVTPAAPGSCGFPGTLDPAKASGAIVLCNVDDAYAANLTGPVLSGAAGIIVPTDVYGTFIYEIPCIQLPFQQSEAVLSYIQATIAPTATLETLTILGVTPAPAMGYFSSVGPNPAESDILKPDITAPGVEILAAWSPISPPLEDGIDKRVLEFSIMSGTSMATPHISGVAALVKALHRDWSPAAIKSALMTTATVHNNAGSNFITDVFGNVSTPLAYGAGMVNPVGAADPGLVYDTTPAEFLAFLCTVAPYNETAIAAVTGNPQPCPAVPVKVHDLNYPTITVAGLIQSESVVRTLTNVGPAPVVNYTVVVTPPAGIAVVVNPSVLSFTSLGHRLSFTVDLSVNASGPPSHAYSFGSIVWTDGVHNVRSVVAVRTVSLAQVFSQG